MKAHDITLDDVTEFVRIYNQHAQPKKNTIFTPQRIYDELQAAINDPVKWLYYGGYMLGSKWSSCSEFKIRLFCDDEFKVVFEPNLGSWEAYAQEDINKAVASFEGNIMGYIMVRDAFE